MTELKREKCCGCRMGYGQGSSFAVKKGKIRIFSNHYFIKSETNKYRKMDHVMPTYNL